MKIATDIGGTFTDIVYIDKKGNVGADKVHTTPPNFEQGVLNSIEKCREAIDREELENFVHGTTVVINALTEKKGAKTALLTTKGFRDIYEIARGNRPDLFNFMFQKSVPVVPRYLRREIDERMDYMGEEIRPVDEKEVKHWIDYFKSEGVESIAVVYINSYKNDVHERQTVDIIKKYWPEVYVTGSYEITNEWREYERTSTTALNAFVRPSAAAYIDKLEKELEKQGITSKKYIMQSNGGTTTFEKAKKTPINMVESGPVAGIYGAAILGKIIGESQVIAFDIGGTTAKCSLIDNGEVKISTDYMIDKTPKTAGHPVKVPVVDIVEIGNGGGSIAWIDDRGSLNVGPQSAGASPGPIAYGQGGESPTTTDANLVAGRLSPENFDMNVNMDKVKSGIKRVVSDPLNLSIEEGALGIIRIANSNMLNALKLVSVRRGYDPRDFTLVAFGGGGPMHAAALAKELGIKKVVIPRVASVFSAWGMLMSDLRQDDIQTNIVRINRNTDFDEINTLWKTMENNAIREFEEKGIPKENVVCVRTLDMRYVAQEHVIKVVQPDEKITANNFEDLIEQFHQAHEKAYSFKMDSEAEIVNLHLISYGKVGKPALAKLDTPVLKKEETIKETRSVIFEHVGKQDTTVYLRNKLSPGMLIQGPAIIEEISASTLIYPGMKAEVDSFGNLIIYTGGETNE